MGSKNTSTKNVLQNHSKAKVRLYTEYLLLYLHILGNNKYVSRIHLFDVLCGEGKYADGAEGSALRGLRTVVEYFTTSPSTKLKLNIWLNDYGQSVVQKKLKKIQRVEEHASGIALPADKAELKYSDHEYSNMLTHVEAVLAKFDSSEKALIFIDPWGYKSINPKELNKLFGCGRAEILLFLPTTLMYRFANKALEAKGEAMRKCYLPLKHLLEDLFDNHVPIFRSFDTFDAALLEKLKLKLGAVYGSSFGLETEDRNKYSIFFFTPNIKGLSAFNEVCWKLDEVGGKGFYVGPNANQYSLFNGPDHMTQVRELIFSSPVTNKQVYEFGVINNQLTKSTSAALNILRERGEIVVEALDGLPHPKKNANYLEYSPKRLIQFKRVK